MTKRLHIHWSISISSCHRRYSTSNQSASLQGSMKGPGWCSSLLMMSLRIDKAKIQLISRVAYVLRLIESDSGVRSIKGRYNPASQGMCGILSTIMQSRLRCPQFPLTVMRCLNESILYDTLASGWTSLYLGEMIPHNNFQSQERPQCSQINSHIHMLTLLTS